MTGIFRGHGQEKRTGSTKGSIPQRQLVKILAITIDTARAKAAGRGRDEARATLRLIMAEANWSTPYVFKNIGARRCRYLAGLGYKIPYEDATRSTIDRLQEWGRTHD